MIPGQRLGEPLVIAGQPPKAGGPRKRAFHHPTFGQEHKAFLGLRQFHHFQFDPVFLGGCRRRWPRVALIHIRQFDVLAGDLLHRLRFLAPS